MNQTLSEDAIRQLCARAREGSESAREQIIRIHMPLVVHVATYFYRPGCFCEMGDLVQQGCLGLLHAITKFNPETVSRGRRVRFATYAHFWVTHSIRREIENNGRTISIPIKRLREAKEEYAYAVPMNQGEWLEDEDGAAIARLVDLKDTAQNWTQAWEARQEVEQLLNTLPARDQGVLKSRYGLNEDVETLTQRQTGHLFGVSSALIGLIERAALQHLREQSHWATA